jgi:hypothetical protein
MTNLQRLVGIVVSPARTYEDINRRPTWLPPILLLLIFNLAINFVVFRVILNDANFDRIARAKITWDAQAAGAAVSPAVMQQKIDALHAQSTLWYLAPFFSVFISTLAITALLYIVFRLQKPGVSFLKMFAIVCWSFIIYRCVGGIPTIANLLAQGPSGFVPAPPEAWSPTSLAHLVARSSVDPNVYSALSKIDVFLIWWLGVIAIGVSKTVPNLSLPRAATTIVITEAIYLVANATGVLSGTL